MRPEVFITSINASHAVGKNGMKKNQAQHIEI